MPEKLPPPGGFYTTARLYAMRLSAAGDWFWEQCNLPQEAYLAALRGAGIGVAEVVLLQQRWMRRDRVDRPGTYLSGRQREWVLDILSRRWSSGEDPLMPPPGNPVYVKDISIAFELPRSGWIATVLRAGDFRLPFMASDTDDPLPILVVWLEAVAYGQFPRVTLDLEEDTLKLRALPAEAPLVRVLITKTECAWNDDEADERVSTLDVAVDRETLVRSLYGALIAFTQSDAFRQGWDSLQWTRRPGLEEEAAVVPPYDLRSERLERILSVCLGGS